MNRRIWKKKQKQHHKQFCGKPVHRWQCPECGWDTIEADEEMEMGKILWTRGGFCDYEFEVEYKCPVCRTVFSFCDGA